VSPAETPARKRFREFIVGIAVLHAVAIALFYALDMRHAAPARQRYFAWIWMVATVAAIFVGLQRIRRARLNLNRNRS
jgi:hypothetical protein